jgi:hypothetical protein
MVERLLRSASDRDSYATIVKVSHWMGDQNLLSPTPPPTGPARVMARSPYVKSIRKAWVPAEGKLKG